jgi:hypothetical protein
LFLLWTTIYVTASCSADEPDQSQLLVSVTNYSPLFWLHWMLNWVEEI